MNETLHMTDYGYMRIGAGIPAVRPADVDANVEALAAICREASSNGVAILVTPELSVTGYTCGDLFTQTILLEKAERGVGRLAEMMSDSTLLFAVGCPVRAFGRLFNCAVIICAGKILGIVPKTHLPNYGEFYEKRWFESGSDLMGEHLEFAGVSVPFGSDLLFRAGRATVGVELCEDLWVPSPPSSEMALAGADVILNLSASDELLGKHTYLMELLRMQSARCRCAYAYASAGWGESSTDLVFAGNALVCEDGAVTEASERFSLNTALVTRDVDLEKLHNDRRKFNSFHSPSRYRRRFFTVPNPGFRIPETGQPNIMVDPMPFVPSEEGKRTEHCREIIDIQARGLMQRLNAIHCKTAVIGISGGLDSTLALLVTVRAFDLLGLDRKGIFGITMPGKATTSRTRSNAVGLMEELGVTVLEIPIGKAVDQHFSDIGQDPGKYDVTFENSQARERTQILMDYANKVNAIVVGTGDMSELALGWCTYNGDHMSMYAVNAGVPKTLVKHLVNWFAGEFGGKVSEILLDVMDTPISPELVPSGGDNIGQITEDLVGPYELHDFFLYHVLRNSFGPKKIFMLAKRAFAGKYDDATLLKWLGNFHRRFFNQQFKRSCMPDGPKVGSVCLSPRGDWRMPSDASPALWLKEIEGI